MAVRARSGTSGRGRGRWGGKDWTVVLLPEGWGENCRRRGERRHTDTFKHAHTPCTHTHTHTHTRTHTETHKRQRVVKAMLSYVLVSTLQTGWPSGARRGDHPSSHSLLSQSSQLCMVHTTEERQRASERERERGRETERESKSESERAEEKFLRRKPGLNLRL